MKYLISIIFSLIFNVVYSQGVIYGNIIKENKSDTIWGTLTIYKQVDGIFIQNQKDFRDQFYISLDRGDYIIEVSFGEKTYFENINFDEYESLVVINIPEKETLLSEFDFSEVIFLSPEVFELATKDKKIIYIEF
jgi:hypothetical protein